MKCTVCGKQHSKEQPLTIAYQTVLLCPDCLEKINRHGHAGYSGESGIVFPHWPDTGGITKSVRGYSGTIKVGDVELPLTDFEMK
jgi:hypothetical protein